MQPSDLFPIERCSPRLRTAILAEFNGRSPTFQDILSIPLEKWMTVPGIGRTLLMELEHVIQGLPIVPQANSLATSDDTDLMARLERLQRDLRRLQRDIQALMSEVPSRRAEPHPSDVH